MRERAKYTLTSGHLMWKVQSCRCSVVSISVNSALAFWLLKLKPVVWSAATMIVRSQSESFYKNKTTDGTATMALTIDS